MYATRTVLSTNRALYCVCVRVCACPSVRVVCAYNLYTRSLPHTTSLTATILPHSLPHTTSLTCLFIYTARYDALRHTAPSFPAPLLHTNSVNSKSIVVLTVLPSSPAPASCHCTTHCTQRTAQLLGDMVTAPIKILLVSDMLKLASEASRGRALVQAQLAAARGEKVIHVDMPCQQFKSRILRGCLKRLMAKRCFHQYSVVDFTVFYSHCTFTVLSLCSSS